MNMDTPVFLGTRAEQHGPVLDAMHRWVAHGWLRELDRSFAGFLSRHAPDANPLLILAAALASHRLGRGHACLDLDGALREAVGGYLLLPNDAGGQPAPDGTADTPSSWLATLDLQEWTAALAHAQLVGTGPGATPLVLQDNRLYLRRYWQYEQSVRDAVLQRLAMPTAVARPEHQGALRDALQVLFPQTGEQETDWQMVACALAARQGFGIITGGPGTGKTTTVVRLLAVLQHLAQSSGAAPLRIRLAAPTGKAAARLNESIASAVAGLPLASLSDGEALRSAIPTEVTTVHRLLGSRPTTRRFRHDARNPLPLDLLVLDEASMLDLEMMAAVLAALPAQARLILLGDKDQLASVEAGAVLGNLCQRADDGHYRRETVDWIHTVTGQQIPAALCDEAGHDLDQVVCKLRVSHRFSADSGIGRLAEAVNSGDWPAVQAVAAAGYPDVAFTPVYRGDDAALQALVLDGAPQGFPDAGRHRTLRGKTLAAPVGFRHYLEVLRDARPGADAGQPAMDAWALAVLKAYGQFQLLCALREGPFGVVGLNQRVASLLRAQGWLAPDKAGWYLGRPVLVTRNDYGLGLMNGDIGVTLELPQVDGATGESAWLQRVAFAAGDGSNGIHWVLPSRLNAVETAFAMTVHKSQGSEFTHAALLLPDELSPVLTRELVYTGVTRARHWFTLASAGGAQGVLKDAITRRIDRVSGLSL